MTGTTSAEPPDIASRDASMRWRSVGYWLATVSVAAELGLGGIWDIARIPHVRNLVTHLGYPSYFSRAAAVGRADRPDRPVLGAPTR